MTGRRIAVIGGGISGLTAGYVLSRTDRVTLFEADRRLGGHADTHLVSSAWMSERVGRLDHESARWAGRTVGGFSQDGSSGQGAPSDGIRGAL